MVIFLILVYGFSLSRQSYVNYSKSISSSNSDLVISTELINTSNLINTNKNNSNINLLFGDSFSDSSKSKMPNKPTDSLLSKTKNLKKIKINLDSLRLDSLAHDSTARLQQFTHKIIDKPYTEFYKSGANPFLIYPSVQYMRHIVELDSTGNFVIIKEEVAGNVMKPILKIPIDEYIKLKLKWGMREIWEKKGYAYKLKSEKYELKDLLSNITNIDIPLPSVSFLSIFGPPKISLRVNGSVDIHGAWRNETTAGVTASALGNTKNVPDFKQTVQINVTGKIGDKLAINADWNTERTFQYQNQLKLKYTGYDDEIIQSIEAGNVSLQTTPLIGGSDALFGIKAKFKIGPFSLTALASQKKSQVKVVNVTGGSAKQKYKLHAYDYSTNHYFIDSVYADTTSAFNFFYLYYGFPTFIPNNNARYYEVKDIEVWKSYTGIFNPKARTGSAFIDLRQRTSADDPRTFYDNRRNTNLETVNGRSVVNRQFLLLTPGVDYTIETHTGYITFINQIQDQDAIAVAYRIEGPSSQPGDDIFYGDFIKDIQNDTSKTVILKLVKPPNLKPEYKTAWKLQLRNIYPVGGRDIKKEGFKFKIDYALDGQEPVPELNGVKFLEAFELDKTDESGNSTKPDGKFDFFPNRTILPSTGEIIFPKLQPFGNSYPADLDPGKKYQSVYDTTVTFAKQDRAKDKWLMSGEYSASITSKFQIGFNAVENSVRVTLNGRELKQGVDYQVDYNIGEVNILNDAALVPGANLKITYEQNDLFQLASKTLFGFRGIYDFSKKTHIGFSFLNLNQKTLSEKVRIGEEPINNTIMGVDFGTEMNLPFITKGLDKLFSTSEMSSFKVNGEFAYMNPDPNSKKSTIPDDGGQSIAYIDDFEGAKKIIPIGNSYGNWSDLSVPDKMVSLIGLTKLQQMAYKAKTFWYNVLPSDVTVPQIFGDRKKVATNNQQITVLDLVVRPTQRGTYNYHPNTNFETQPENNWGGMMKSLSSSANNLVEQNINSIQFWMKVEPGTPRDAKLTLDLGEISEDVIPNRKLDTEDKNQNDLLDQGEDTGIDGIDDAEERASITDAFPDPSNDNFKIGTGVNPDNYVEINGTQGNAILSDLGRVPDTEDLNHNFTLDLANNYFRYEISLDTSSANKFIGGRGENGWFQYKIPLKEFTDKVGSPTFTIVKYIRLWATNLKSQFHIRIYDFNLVGNQWQKILDPPRVTEADTTLLVSTVSVEDNPNYKSPPGVFREKDQTQPNQNVLKNEQALQLTINNLKKGEHRDVVKYLFRPLDIFNYKQLKLFVYGDEDSSPGSVSHYESAQNHATDIYFRFGTDTLNYYEYKQPLQAGWRNMFIDFSKLTAIKSTRDIEQIPTTDLFEVPVEGKEGHFYGIKGKPTLTKITFLQFGVYNTPKKSGMNIFDESVSGQIWLNELRVLGADNTKGWAYRTNASLKLADLATISVNTSQTDPYFHKLNQQFGNRVDARNWGVSVKLDVLKLLPFNLKGSNFNLVYSRTESVSKPLYLPGTDILVKAAASRKRQSIEKNNSNNVDAAKAEKQLIEDTYTLNTSESWSVSGFKLRIPSHHWYVRDIINNISLGFNYNKNFSRNPTTLSTKNWIWNASARYNLKFGRRNYFKFADIPVLGYLFKVFKDYKDAKFNFTPQSLSLNATAKRSRNYSQTRGINIKPSISSDFTTSRSFGFNWQVTKGGFLNIGFNYKLNISSSLAYLLNDANNNERSEAEIWHDIFKGAFFGNDYRYSQNLTFKTQPKLPSIFGFDRYFTINFGYNASYLWQRDFRQESLGRSAGNSSSITAGLRIRLKSIFDPLFKSSATNRSSNSNRSRVSRGRRGRRGRVSKSGRASRDRSTNVDKGNTNSTEKKETKSAGNATDENNDSQSILSKGLNFLAYAAKWLFLDYEQININYRQTNSKSGSGLAANRTGFSSFWGFSNDLNNGPSRAFQLGFSNNLGPRAPNGVLSDNFKKTNGLDFKTSRPLWKGAKLDLIWKVNWGRNQTTSLTTDENGNVFVNNITATGTINRSFLSLPKIFFLPFVKSGIEKVNELYDRNAVNRNTNLTEAFRNGMESIPLLSKIPVFSKITQYIPRPNWSISWSGLEKIKFLRKIAKRISLNHSYTSSYFEGWKITPDGTQEVQSQKINYGFTPLIGLNLTFDSFWGGDLTGSIKFNSKTAYDLGISTRKITETFSRDINISLSFSKSGFELPLFGLSLKNDIEFSFSYTNGKNSSVIYEMDNFKPQGIPRNGTTRISLEPRLKYVMSSKVTLSIFYTRTSVDPVGASRVPATKTNIAGLDVRISIQ